MTSAVFEHSDRWICQKAISLPCNFRALELTDSE